MAKTLSTRANYSCDASMCSECFSLHNCAEDGEEEEQEEADEEEEEAEDDATFVTRDSFRGGGMESYREENSEKLKNLVFRKNIVFSRF